MTTDVMTDTDTFERLVFSNGGEAANFQCIIPVSTVASVALSGSLDTATIRGKIERISVNFDPIRERERQENLQFNQGRLSSSTEAEV